MDDCPEAHAKFLIEFNVLFLPVEDICGIEQFNCETNWFMAIFFCGFDVKLAFLKTLLTFM